MYPNSIYFGPKVPIWGPTWPKYILFGYMDPQARGSCCRCALCGVPGVEHVVVLALNEGGKATKAPALIALKNL